MNVVVGYRYTGRGRIKADFFFITKIIYKKEDAQRILKDKKKKIKNMKEKICAVPRRTDPSLHRTDRLEGK